MDECQRVSQQEFSTVQPKGDSFEQEISRNMQIPERSVDFVYNLKTDKSEGAEIDSPGSSNADDESVVHRYFARDTNLEIVGHALRSRYASVQLQGACSNARISVSRPSFPLLSSHVCVCARARDLSHSLSCVRAVKAPKRLRPQGGVRREEYFGDSISVVGISQLAL